MNPIVRVPTITDNHDGFEKLFRIWQEVNDYTYQLRPIQLDFSKCSFLGHNAVAFLGGLARYIGNSYRDCPVEFLWNTMRVQVFANLKRNGFAAVFGNTEIESAGNAIPYREDSAILYDKNDIITYLAKHWLGRGWVNVSSQVTNTIIGKTWEIYGNAFEHSKTPIGVFSCGQHYPSHKKTLAITVVDFGEGIPDQVRVFLKRPDMTAAEALKWAFQSGHTTQNGGRGLGLHILHEFVKKNNGRLDVYSHDGQVTITSHGEYFQNRPYAFHGTLINIQFICDDRFYYFAHEVVDDEPLLF